MRRRARAEGREVDARFPAKRLGPRGDPGRVLQLLRQLPGLVLLGLLLPPTAGPAVAAAQETADEADDSQAGCTGRARQGHHLIGRHA